MFPKSPPIRDDLVANYQRMWRHVAQPGTWWTGAERVGIAQEVRRAQDCDTCAQRKAALSPYAVEDDHSASPGLPPLHHRSLGSY